MQGRSKNVEQTVIRVELAEDKSPVTEIPRKAFLSRKAVRELQIGDSVQRIGDWAFAHMEGLETVELPFHAMIWGKQVFLGCSRLTRIQIRGAESTCAAIPYLMASAVRILKEESLLQPERAGSAAYCGKWIKSYDEKLLHFLMAPDEEGFDPVFIGWFEVKDIDDQLPGYLLKRRMDKAELVLQRLLYPDFLTFAEEEALADYLKNHLPGEGKREHMVVLELLCDGEKEYGQDIRYMQLLDREGLLTESVLEALLNGLEAPSAEVKAFLLNRKAKITEKKDIFDEFVL